MSTLISFLEEAALHPGKKGFVFVDRREKETFFHFSTIYDRCKKAASAM